MGDGLFWPWIPDIRNHGTKAASFAGSVKYESAKRPTLDSYKVDKDDGNAEQASAIRAVAGIIAANDGRKGASGYKNAVINISIDLAISGSLQTQIKTAESKDISVVVAAGNEGIDASSLSALGPCKYEETVCVGAIDEAYALTRVETGGSNYGSRLNSFAPGKNLDSYDNKGDKVGGLDGASFASPYVAGIVAAYYSYEGSRMNSDRAKSLPNRNAENGILSGLKGSPNILANNGYPKTTAGLLYIGGPANSFIKPGCHYEI